MLRTDRNGIPLKTLSQPKGHVVLCSLLNLTTLLTLVAKDIVAVET